MKDANFSAGSLYKFDNFLCSFNPNLLVNSVPITQSYIRTYP